MMDVARPHLALCPTLDSDVLNVLAGTSRPMTGREVARLAGRASHSGVLGVLSRLVEHGLVERQEAGRALLYRLNRDHLAAPAVAVLAGMRSEFLSRLRGEVDSWALAASHVSLFGSTARGEGGTGSDVDLFVVRPSEIADEDPCWRDQIDRLATSVLRWTGNHAGIAEVSDDEIGHWIQDEPAILRDLRSDGIDLCGPPIDTLLARGARRVR